MNIPAIETGVLPPPDSYLDRDNNIPPEDGDQPPPPLPAEIDPMWHHQGYSWPYVPDAYDESGGFDSQPPSQPPSPGLSYRTPRTPSLRHRSVTPSHHSSGNSQPRSTHSHPSSGDMSSRSHTLTEEGNPFAYERGLFPSTPAQPVTPYTPRLGVPTLNDYPREWMEGFCSGKYTDIPFYDEWKRGRKPVLAQPEQAPSRLFEAEVENPRAEACRQVLESPLAPQSLAIPQSKIASYPREWHDGARSGKYSDIPSYQGW